MTVSGDWLTSNSYQATRKILREPALISHWPVIDYLFKSLIFNSLSDTFGLARYLL